MLGTGLCEYRMKVGEFHITVDKTDEKEVVSEDEGTRDVIITWTWYLVFIMQRDRVVGTLLKESLFLPSFGFRTRISLRQH